jgi:DNA-binding MarR family transcriptional regulator
MSTTQAPPIPFGRHLGAAQRAGRAFLDEVLVVDGTTYETWIALNLLATSGPRTSRAAFEQSLGAALEIRTAAAAQLLGQMERYGVVRTEPDASGDDGPRIALTEEGSRHFQRLLAAVNERSAQALAGVDPADVQTTIRVLAQFKAQAEASLRH